MNNDEQILSTLQKLLDAQEQTLAIQKQAFENQQKALASQQTALKNQLAIGRIYRVAVAVVAAVVATWFYFIFHVWR